MRRFFITLFALSISVPAFAFDPALNRDRLPCPRPCQQVDITKWATDAGFDFSDESFARGLVGVFTGVRKNIDKNVNLNIQASTGLFMGLTF